jgi:hypothetical protein
VKSLCLVAEPSDCFNLKGCWVVMAHNLGIPLPLHQRVRSSNLFTSTMPLRTLSEVARPLRHAQKWRRRKTVLIQSSHPAYAVFASL